MKKVSDTYKELGIDFTFPITIKNANGDRTYHERSDGYWWKCDYDSKGNRTYSVSSSGYWWRCDYDPKGHETYYEDSSGYKKGTPQSQSCAGKVIEVDGKKYKLMEL